MKAMLLAAGRGKRLRPLTDNIPKPLLAVGGRPIIEYTIEALETAGFKDLVINLAHLGDQIESVLGDGNRLNVAIRYSREGHAALETGGGIFRALPLLGEKPFLVVNGDIFCEFPYQRLLSKSDNLAHLVLVPNPPHHQQGDFALTDDGKVCQSGDSTYTFSGIGVYRPELFDGCKDGVFPLSPLLREAMEQGKVSGELYRGLWIDIGTVARLESLNQRMTDDLRD